MGTTPTYALPYPAASDAADGPTQIQALAAAVENLLIARFKPLYVEKAADESVTSSTTLQTDNHLFLNSIPIGSWELSGEIFATGISSAAQDIKLSFAFPTGVISWSGVSFAEAWVTGANASDVYVGGTVNSSVSPTSSQTFGLVTGATVPIQLKGHLVNSGVGNLVLSWAQATSNASATTVKQGSWMSLRPLA